MKAIVHVQDAINITRIHRTHVNKGLKEQSYDLYISDTKGMGKCYINEPDGSRREIAIHGGGASRSYRMLNNLYSKLWE